MNEFGRKIYNTFMGFLLIAVSLLLFFIHYLPITKVFVLDDFPRIMFASICLLYGGFRLYGVFKKQDD